MNRLMTSLTAEIMANNGTIDKYMGDGVMAFWNAPLGDADHALNACAAALSMATALDRLNAEALDDARKGMAGAEHRIFADAREEVGVVQIVGPVEAADAAEFANRIGLGSPAFGRLVEIEAADQIGQGVRLAPHPAGDGADIAVHKANLPQISALARGAGWVSFTPFRAELVEPQFFSCRPTTE